MGDERERDERRKEDLGEKGQYGGLERGLGYGGGRDIRDAERPGKDLDPDETERRDDR